MTSLHPSLAIPIAVELHRLRERYGVEPTVRVYDPPEGDTSLGSTQGTTISCNAHWFAEPIGKLVGAARVGDARGDPGMPTFHARLPEPRQFAVHEFGHCLWNARLHTIPEFVRFRDAGHAAVLADPGTAPSGYSLAHPDEFFAEAFCCAEIGGEALRANPFVAQMRWLLEMTWPSG